jgi:sterol desaturase/sphingolipid hydroxylase (fatty acid hydroxylase superfamily)
MFQVIASAAVSAFDWYRQHAVAVFAVAVIGAIVFETSHRLWNWRRVDLDAVATSVVSGAAFLVVKNVISKLALLTLSMWVYDNHRIFDLDLSSPLVWLVVFLIRDFIYYWVHRTEHRVRVLWASHLVHHSPEHIGFTTAVRVPWMEAVYKPWLSLWVPLLGFHPLAFVALDVLAATFAQLYHTEACRRRTILDAVFVTPAAHRVHHGSNDEYIDKNFGAVFIIWDRLFGTYEPEVAPVVYGIGPDKAIDSPYEALVGGYPELFRESADEIRSTGSLAAGLRHLVAAPG